MSKDNSAKGNLQEFLTDRIIDSNISKSGIIFSSREASKKLVNVSKLLRTKKICGQLK